MNELERKQYQTVILAGLLHDIGKFMQRVIGDNRFEGEHPELGALFVSGEGPFAPEGDRKDLYSFSLQIREEWVDRIELAKAIKTHHRGSGVCGCIVHRADSYSTKERFEKGQTVKTYPPRGPAVALGSVFSHIDLGSDRQTENYGYAAAPLDSMKAAPVKNKPKLESNEADGLFKDFADELAAIQSAGHTFDEFFQTLCAILEKYAWCLPCHTHPDVADVSIFDHLRSCSAIAACLYLYHFEKNTLELNSIKDDAPSKFLLVGGDLSGIQKYIYQIAAITGEGGVAKRLRARSFYISALVEVTVVKLLQALDLPVVCNLVSAGGHFVLLAPNTESTKQALADQLRGINQWLLEHFSGELALSLDWSTTLTGDDFHRATFWRETGQGLEETAPDQFRTCNYRDRIDGLRWQLDQAKLGGFKSVLTNGPGWDQEVFVLQRQYHAYYQEGRSDCKSCRKFPAVMSDPHEDEEIGTNTILCEKCFSDKILGRLLLDAEYLVVGKAEKISAISKGSKRFYFYDDNYYIEPQNDIRQTTPCPADHKVLVVQRLRDHHDEKRPLPMGAVHRFMANYAPFFRPDDSMDICRQCKNDGGCETQTAINQGDKRRQLLTFECLAAAGCEPPDKDGVVRGATLLGVLKADVDNLGLIFSQGLGSRVTVSRYLTLSRMIDLFFSGWVYRILKEDQKFKHIYTVYSGGDDLVLVGPWQAILRFAGHLNAEFRRFTCNNPDITLSAGISVVHPKHPISDAVTQAEINLQKSKAAGKNRLTLFNTTIEWHEYPMLSHCADMLHENHHRFREIFTVAFMHRLLIYHQMYLNTQSGRIHDLIFLARMHNDVRRNLIERLEAQKQKHRGESEFEERSEKFQDEIIDGVMQALQHTAANPCLMRNLKIPLFWTLYRNRTFLTRRYEYE